MEKHTLSSLIWLRMVRFVDRSNQLSNEFLAQFDLTVAQFEVLVKIRAYAPITQMDLAQKLTVSRGGISRMLTRLEKEQFIQRKQQWKIKEITLTEKGHAKLDEVYNDQVAFQASMFDDTLDEVEKEQLNHLMKKLYKNIMEKQCP